MSFISYAQHGEDVMLMRALKHVEHGFYIDVGANHPSEDSVTKAFYDRGWRGLNIEPLPEHIAQLRAARLRDINLQVAAGASEGEITLYNTPVRGLATASAEVAQRHASQGLATIASVVPMRPLADICAQYVAGQDIHFLKIDVEGFETDVLQGMDFQRFRPWIALVEATLPNSQQISADWEPLVVNAGYRKVFFDGLNRYYIAEEHPELADAFAAPPNVFDGYITAKQASEATMPKTVTNAQQNIYEGPNGYLLQMVRSELINSKAFTQDDLDTGGYTIVTTIDKSKQDLMYQTASPTKGNAGMPDGVQTGGLSVNVKDGSIISLYAGEDYLKKQLNNVTDATYEVGSTMKPFTLLSTVQTGVSLDTVFNGNSPRSFPGLKQPMSNSGGASYGYINLYKATANSVNTVYMDLQQHLGADTIIKTAHTAGIKGKITDDGYVTLGNSGLSMIDMARGFSTIAITIGTISSSSTAARAPSRSVTAMSRGAGVSSSGALGR